MVVLKPLALHPYILLSTRKNVQRSLLLSWSYTLVHPQRISASVTRTTLDVFFAYSSFKQLTRHVTLPRDTSRRRYLSYYATSTNHIGCSWPTGYLTECSSVRTASPKFPTFLGLLLRSVDLSCCSRPHSHCLLTHFFLCFLLLVFFSCNDRFLLIGLTKSSSPLL